MHLLCSLLLLAAIPAAAHAQEPGSELTVYLATFGQGDAVWEKFGHNAIWIRDAATNTTTSFDYGRFDADEPGFLRRFLRGRMLYTMGLTDAALLLQHYADMDRQITVQQLNLAPAQRLALREALELNWLDPDYRYDYFRDNCSTRVRDMLDLALGGALSRELQGRSTATTYREESLRLTADALATYTGLIIGLGKSTDVELDAWEASFIPMRLRDYVREIEVQGPDGTMVPLVAAEHVAYASTRGEAPVEPPSRTLPYLGIGVLLAGVLLAVGRRAGESERARAVTALLISLWGIATGLLGTLLALLLLTDHSAAHHNLNLLQMNPLGLLLAVAAPLAFLAPERFPRAARFAWPGALALAGLCVTGLLLNAVPGLGQQNGEVIALVLPIHLAVVLCMYNVLGAEPSPVEDVSLRLVVPNAA